MPDVVQAGDLRSEHCLHVDSAQSAVVDVELGPCVGGQVEYAAQEVANRVAVGDEYDIASRRRLEVALECAVQSFTTRCAISLVYALRIEHLLARRDGGYALAQVRVYLEDERRNRGGENLRRLACAAHVACYESPDALFGDATRSALYLAAAKGGQPAA